MFQKKIAAFKKNLQVLNPKLGVETKTRSLMLKMSLVDSNLIHTKNKSRQQPSSHNRGHFKSHKTHNLILYWWVKHKLFWAGGVINLHQQLSSFRTISSMFLYWSLIK